MLLSGAKHLLWQPSQRRPLASFGVTVETSQRYSEVSDLPFYLAAVAAPPVARTVARVGLSSSALRRLAALGALAVTLVAFVARVWTLGAASLWYDEGYSLSVAAKTLPDLYAALVPADNNPPLHYLLLHFWLPLAGASEFAIRYVSLVPGVLLVPLAFATVREVYAGRPSAAVVALAGGVPAAALVALSPYLLYYAQEARMYSQLACFALGATLTLLHATRERSNWPVWLLHSVLLAALLYSHYAGVLLLPALALYAALGGGRLLLRWLAAAALTGLLWLPWLPSLLIQVRRFGANPDYFPARLSFGAVLGDIWSSFLAVRFPWAAALLGMAAVGAAGFAIAWLGTRDRAVARRLTLLVLAAAVPMLTTAAAATVVPKFVARYAIVGAPALYAALPLLLLVLLGWRSPFRVALYAVIVLAALVFAARLTWDAAASSWAAKDNVRGIAQYLNERVKPSNTVLHIRNEPEAFDYYYRGSAPRTAMDVGLDYAAGAERLNAVLQTRPDRVWLVLWQHEFTDPSGFVITELTRRSDKPPTIRTNFAGHVLMSFQMEDWSPVAAQPTPQRALDAAFADRLTLVGADRLSDAPSLARWVLYWAAQQPLDHDYAVTVQLVDAQGAVRVSHNQGLSTPYFATAAFPVGLAVRGLTQVALPADLPAGVYEARALVWDTRDQRNLPVVGPAGVADGVSVPLGSVVVQGK